MALKCTIIDINLHPSKAATALLCRKLAIKEMDVALIQEPWVHGDRIRGLRNRWGTLFPAGPGIHSRARISMRNTIQAFPLLELRSRYVVTVRLSLTEEGALRILFLPLHTCPTSRTNHPHRGNYGTSSTIAVGTNYSSSLDAMLMHTALYGGALASILEEAVYCNIW
jgi:hypothetical protein